MKITDWSDEDKSKWLSEHSFIGVYTEEDTDGTLLCDWLRSNRLSRDTQLEISFNDFMNKLSTDTTAKI